jgi:hypothetical protein
VKEVPMARTVAEKTFLELIALVEIRSLAGCETTIAVIIEPVPYPRSGNNWRIAAVEGIPKQAATRAITFVQRKLRERYTLRSTPKTAHQNPE